MAKLIGWVAVFSAPAGIAATIFTGSATYAAIGFASTVFLTALAMMLLEPSEPSARRPKRSGW